MSLAELKSKTIEERIDHITLVHDRYKTKFAPAPISCKIEITAACNWKCDFCIKSLRQDTRMMERPLYTRLLDELKEAGVQEIGVFYIGESFVAKELLPWAIKEAKDRGFFVFLTTNGAAASPERLLQVFEAGLDSLKFSVNFYDDEQFERITGVHKRQRQRSYAMIREARRIRDEGKFDCQISASSIKFTGEQAAKMRVVLDEIEPYLDRPAYFLPLYDMSGATATNLKDWKPVSGNPGRADMMRPAMPCHCLFTETFITVDGLLSGCSFGTGTIDGSLIMADLKEMSFSEGWNSVYFQELRQKHLDGNVRGTGCESCVYGSADRQKSIPIVVA